MNSIELGKGFVSTVLNRAEDAIVETLYYVAPNGDAFRSAPINRPGGRVNPNFEGKHWVKAEKLASLPEGVEFIGNYRRPHQF